MVADFGVVLFGQFDKEKFRVLMDEMQMLLPRLSTTQEVKDASVVDDRDRMCQGQVKALKCI